MKKRIYTTILIIIMIFTMVACGSKSADGTWYSVTDSTMYQFESGKVTCAGQVVGQYEDNGDSIVLSLIDGTKNLQLYVTTMDGVDILADVKTGEGMIYFCNGLENVEKIAEQSDKYAFQNFIEENLIGKWKIFDPRNKDAMEYVEFTDDMIRTYGEDGTSKEYHITNSEFGTEDGTQYIEFEVYPGESKDVTFPIRITPGSTYLNSGELIMDDDRLIEKVES